MKSEKIIRGKFVVLIAALGIVGWLSIFPSVALSAPSIGLTVITHGHNSETTGWVRDMAIAIANRSENPASIPIYTMSIGMNSGQLQVDSFSPEPGRPLINLASTSQVIILVDWSEVSDGVNLTCFRPTIIPGFPAKPPVSTTMVGDLVANYLLDTSIWGERLLVELPIHLIGHSRGTSVNSDVAFLLGKSGIWVEHVTNLDAHPLLTGSDPGVGQCTDFPVSTWKNTLFADSYYRYVNSFWLNPAGNSVRGAYEINLNNIVKTRLINFKPVFSHTQVHTYYHGTIDLSETVVDSVPILSDTWYGISPSPPRDKTGFAFSRNISNPVPWPQSGMHIDLGGSGSRQPVSAAVANTPWPNVYLRPVSKHTYQAGDTIIIPFHYQDADSTMRISFSLDDDTNPFNTTAIRCQNLIGSISNLAQRTTIGSGQTPWTTDSADVGRCYLQAKASDASGHIRYDYLRKPITISTAPPTGLNPPTTISPGTSTDTGSAVSSLTPTFTWNAASGATSYGLYISKAPYGPANLVYTDTTLSGTSFTIPNGYLASGTKYRWQMTSFNNGDESANASRLLYFQAPAITTYAISAVASPLTGGWAAGSSSYDAGAAVTVFAAANIGYEFSGWTENGILVSSSSIYTFSAVSDRNLVANFSATPVTTHTLGITAVNGTVSRTPNQASYTAGSQVSLRATPNAGYRFSGWGGDASSAANPLIITMNTNKGITANFTATTHTLTITSPVAGTPSPVIPGGIANLNVSAVDSLGHNLNYSWTASCPNLGSTGRFISGTATRSPKWVAPLNNTGSQQACSIQVDVSDGLGLGRSSTYIHGVSPGGATSLSITDGIKFLETPPYALSGTATVDVTIKNISSATVILDRIQAIGSFTDRDGSVYERFWPASSFNPPLSLAPGSLYHYTKPLSDNFPGLATTATVMIHAKFNNIPGQNTITNFESPAIAQLLFEVGHVVTITNGPSSDLNPVPSGGTTTLNVNASDSLGHNLIYAWTASCPELPSNGNFNSTTSRTPTWAAPQNITGSEQNCTIQVETSDGKGQSDQKSYIQKVSTELDTTAPVAVNLSTGAVTTTSVTLAWKAPGDDGNTGTATSYDIRYSTSPITEANWASANTVLGEPSPQVANTIQSFTVTGLICETTYFFAIKTSDEVPNTSGISPRSSETTAACQVSFDFSLSATNASVVRGENTTSTVTVTLVSGSSAPVTFSLPTLTGTIFAFSPDSTCSPSCNRTLNITTSSTTPLGLHTINITATGGKSTSFTLEVKLVNSADSDNDGLPDSFELAHGLNPNDPLDAQRDPDGDTYTNLEEFLGGTDPQNAESLPIRPFVVETSPHDGQGIVEGTQRIPIDSSIAIRIKDGDDGIDPNSIFMTVEGVGVQNGVRTKAVNGAGFTDIWVIYDTANQDTDNDGKPDSYEFAFDQEINVRIMVSDTKGIAMNPYEFSFKVESQQEHDTALAAMPTVTTSSDPVTGISTIEAAQGTQIAGAKILFNPAEPVTPRFGPVNEIPPLTAPNAAGLPLNLEPPTVFDNPVTLFIPAPGVSDLSLLKIYVFTPERGWQLASGVAGWMVPGSRINHSETSPPTIEIQVNHFTGAQAAEPPSAPPSAPKLVFPANGETGLEIPVTFGWNRSVDPGDAVSYGLIVCEDSTFTGCSPENVAKVSEKSTDYAALGLGVGLIFGIVMIGGVKGRKKIGLFIVGMMITASLLVSCDGEGGSGGSDSETAITGDPPPAEVTKIISNLNPGTIYHWKVRADDGKGGISESEPRSFTTAP